MEPLVDRDDISALLSGVFDLNTKLGHIMDDIHAIRGLMEDDDGEEEEAQDTWPTP
jgi:hypothetical protein